MCQSWKNWLEGCQFSPTQQSKVLCPTQWVSRGHSDGLIRKCFCQIQTLGWMNLDLEAEDPSPVKWSYVFWFENCFPHGVKIDHTTQPCLLIDSRSWMKDTHSHTRCRATIVFSRSGNGLGTLVGFISCWFPNKQNVNKIPNNCLVQGRGKKTGGPSWFGFYCGKCMLPTIVIKGSGRKATEPNE